MENVIKISNFLSKEDKQEVIKSLNELKNNASYENTHISKIVNGLKGDSYMFDITKTNVSEYLSSFQSDKNTRYDTPDIILKLKDKISLLLGIDSSNVFAQLIDMYDGGLILPHYDTSIDGFITYKCNISVVSHDFKLYIEGYCLDLKENDLYTFEASLYKHWTNEFSGRRILISYGFALKYSDLNRDSNDYRVRLSNRIERYFQRK